jgi:hypothetical protein
MGGYATYLDLSYWGLMRGISRQRAKRFPQKPSGQPRLSGAGRFQFGGYVFVLTAVVLCRRRQLSCPP